MKHKTIEKQAKRQAILWGRFSSDQQKDSDSRDRQERNNRLLAERLGIQVIKEYFDPAVSVKDGATPLFKKVIADLPSGVGIITEHLDRINRGHPWRAKAYIADILEEGHFIITSQDGREYTADTIGELDTLVIGDLSANVAYAENSKRIKRVKEAKAAAIELARQGKPAPLGKWIPSHLRYNFETHQYNVLEDKRAIYERIFEEYAAGKGTSNIARGLNADRIPTFFSKKVGGWVRSSISEILRYQGVIGTLTINKERIPNAFPPAISEKLFYQVDRMLKQNKDRHGNYTSTRVNNILRGVCHCVKCGSSMKVYKQKYLGCAGYRDGKCDTKTIIPFTMVERAFASWIIPVAKDSLLGKDETHTAIKSLEAKLNHLVEEIDKTLLLLGNPSMPQDRIEKRLTSLQAERQQTENALASAKAEHSSKASMPDTLESLEGMIDSIHKDQTVRAKVAAILPTIIEDIKVDLSDRHFPTFDCKLINKDTMKWTYGV